MGLRSKLFILLLTVFVVPLSSLGVVGYWIVKKQLFNDAITAQKSLTEHLLLSARREIDLARDTLQLMASDVQLVTELQRNSPVSSDYSIDTLVEILSRLSQRGQGLVEIGLYDSLGHFIEGSRLLVEGQSGVFGFDELLSPTEGVSEPPPVYLLKLRSGIEVEVAREVEPIRGSLGQILGYLAVNAQPVQLNMAVEGYEWKAMHFLFVNANGHILAASDALSGELSVQLQQWAVPVSNEVFSSETVVLDGRSFRVVKEQVSDQVWLVSLLELGKVYGELRHGFIVLMSIAALMLVFAVFLYFRQLTRVVIAPIDTLNSATERISKGDFMPLIPIESDDEIGRLADAFRSMGSRLQETNEQIAQLAFYDPLTKLPNRETLKRSLGKMVDNAARSQSLLGVLFVDLDDFKKVNDRLGHSAGDELLVEVGKRLSHALRSSDLLVGGADDHNDLLISRRGGDEFNAVVSNIRSARDIALIAERLITDINQPMTLAGSPVSVSASVGVAIFPFDGEDAETLLRNADLAMYEAKALGKNKYYLYTQTINEQVKERLEAEQQIAGALKHNEFELYYQPVMYAEGLDLASFEALIRWRHPQSGLLAPDEFMPLAEESQLIHDLGRWTMAEAMSQLLEWQEWLPSGARIAINISARQLIQEHFADNFLSLARQIGVSLLQLEIELTESSLLTDESLVKDHLLALSNEGVKITLDDFGTGFSSFTFLRNLPIDCVKIDAQVIQSIDQGEESAEAVAALLTLCGKLHLDTLAEGVETQTQLLWLQQHGCTYCQGYLFHPPVPAEEVRNLIQS